MDGSLIVWKIEINCDRGRAASVNDHERGRQAQSLENRTNIDMKTKLIALMIAGVGIAFAAPEAPTSAAGKIPAWLDTDGDGVISELERQAYIEARRAAVGSLSQQWDTNGDGVIDDDERAAAIEELKARANARISELFLAAAGEDEVLTIEEFAALAPEQIPAEVVSMLFGMLDADNDGQITLDEFLNFAGPPTSPPAIPELPVPAAR